MKMYRIFGAKTFAFMSGDFYISPSTNMVREKAVSILLKGILTEHMDAN